MAKYKITHSNSYQKDIKKLDKETIALVENIIDRLANGEVLEPKYQDHALKSSPCHSDALAEESQKSDCHTKIPSCHSEPALAGEESNQNRDVSASPQHDKEKMQHNKTNLHYPKNSPYHSKNPLCHSSPPFCHSKPSSCHSERSEESNRDISLVSQAQYDKPSYHIKPLDKVSQENTIILTQNQIAFSKYPAFIYMVSNKNNTTLYIGVTSNLQKRIYEHKNHLAKGFSDKYNCEKLVYFESFDNINQAIEREKYLKGKKRAFKENLINAINPKWLDLYDYLFCHSEALAEESHIVDSNKDISLTLNRTNSGVCHSATSPCHSEPALAGEESNPSCHTKPLGEVSYKSNRDISHFSNAQYDKMTSTRHSEALAEESQKSDCHSKTPSCHSERSEESNRDISLVSQAQYDNKGRK